MRTIVFLISAIRAPFSQSDDIVTRSGRLFATVMIATGLILTIGGVIRYQKTRGDQATAKGAKGFIIGGLVLAALALLFAGFMTHTFSGATP